MWGQFNICVQKLSKAIFLLVLQVRVLLKTKMVFGVFLTPMTIFGHVIKIDPQLP